MKVGKVRDILSTDNFYFASAFFGMSSLLAGGLNYIYYPIIAHYLSPANFGEANTLVSLSTIASSVLLSLNVLSVFFVANFSKQAKDIIEAYQKAIIYFFLACTLLLVALFPLLQAALHLTSLSALLATALSLVVNIPVVFWTGYLQGHSKFFSIGVFTLIAAAGKVVSLVALAIVSHGLGFLLLSLTLGPLLAMVYLRATSNIPLPSVLSVLGRFTPAQRLFIRTHIRYVGFVIICIAVVSTLFASDIIVTKHYFSPHLAGLYSGISSIARLVFYVCSLLVWLMLPSLSLHNSASRNRTVLFKSLALAAALGGVGIIALTVAKDFVVGVALGDAYTPYAHLLPALGVIQLVVAGLYLYITYLLVLDRKKALLFTTLPTVLAFVTMASNHGTFSNLVRAYFSGLLIGVGLAYIASLFAKLIARNRYAQ